MVNIKNSTLRTIAAKCGQSELYSHLEQEHASVSADKKEVCIFASDTKVWIEVVRKGHGKYKPHLMQGNVTKEYDVVGFCKKIIQYCRKKARSNRGY